MTPNQESPLGQKAQDCYQTVTRDAVVWSGALVCYAVVKNKSYASDSEYDETPGDQGRRNGVENVEPAG
ncbi:Peroxisome assembly protein [Trichinella pseudospiralis]